MLATRLEILKNKKEFNKRRLTEDYARREFNVDSFLHNNSRQYKNSFMKSLYDHLPGRSAKKQNGDTTEELIIDDVNFRIKASNYILGKRLVLKAQNKYEKLHNLPITTEENILTVTKKDHDEYEHFINNIDQNKKPYKTFLNNDGNIVDIDDCSPKVGMMLIQKAYLYNNYSLCFDKAFDISVILCIFAINMRVFDYFYKPQPILLQKGIYINLFYKHMKFRNHKQNVTDFAYFEWRVLINVIQHDILSIKQITEFVERINGFVIDPIDYVLSNETVLHFPNFYSVNDIYSFYGEIQFDVLQQEKIRRCKRM